MQRYFFNGEFVYSRREESFGSSGLGVMFTISHLFLLCIFVADSFNSSFIVSYLYILWDRYLQRKLFSHLLKEVVMIKDRRYIEKL